MPGADRTWQRHVDTKWDTMYTFTGLEKDQGKREDVEKAGSDNMENPVQW